MRVTYGCKQSRTQIHRSRVVLHIMSLGDGAGEKRMKRERRERDSQGSRYGFGIPTTKEMKKWRSGPLQTEGMGAPQSEQRRHCQMQLPIDFNFATELFPTFCLSQVQSIFQSAASVCQSLRQHVVYRHQGRKPTPGGQGPQRPPFHSRWFNRRRRRDW